MHHNRCKEEQSETDDLHHQANDDHYFSDFLCALLGRQTGRIALDHERKPVAENEGFCKPLGGDGGVMFCVEKAEEVTERHVDRAGVQGWSEEDEDGLKKVWHQI